MKSRRAWRCLPARRAGQRRTRFGHHHGCALSGRAVRILSLAFGRRPRATTEPPLRPRPRRRPQRGQPPQSAGCPEHPGPGQPDRRRSRTIAKAPIAARRRVAHRPSRRLGRGNGPPDTPRAHIPPTVTIATRRPGRPKRGIPEPPHPRLRSRPLPELASSRSPSPLPLSSQVGTGDGAMTVTKAGWPS